MGAAQKKHYAKMRAAVDAFKDVPCMDCGRRYPSCVMDFDHRDPTAKAFSIGMMITNTSLDALLAEIAKCDVVCSNCHRIRTANQRARAI